jgi:hypothetical protein
MKATKPPVRNPEPIRGPGTAYSAPSVTDDGTSTHVPAQGPGHRLAFYYQTDGTIPWISVAVAGAGTTFSAPARTYNPIGKLVTVTGPGNSLLFYWQHSESRPFNPEQVAPPDSIA